MITRVAASLMVVAAVFVCVLAIRLTVVRFSVNEIRGAELRRRLTL